MDFSYLLELAAENKKRPPETSGNLLQTKLSNPKKIARPAPRSEAVQAFLNKKEEKKRKEGEEFKRKRDELLYKRSLDKHNSKRMNTMIKRTKGASKAVLDDAKDLITVNGEEECGEDDYGYESVHSQSIFHKLQNQYREAPKDDRLNFKKTAKRDLKNIKSRVIDSLRQEQDETLGIRKRHRKRKSHHVDDEDSAKISHNTYSGSYRPDRPPPRPKEEEKPKIKRLNKGPPPMSFKELMKVAEKKATEPLPASQQFEIVIKTETSEPPPRLMTAKEKKEFEEEQQRKLRREGKLPKDEPEKVKKPTKSIDSKDEKPAKPIDTKDQKPSKPIVKEKTFDKSKYFAVPNASKKPNVSNPVPKSSKPVPTRPHPAEYSKRDVPQKKPAKVQQRPSRVIDDESDYDSEMDDFIDDGDAELDYSSEISKIFGYDKSRYRAIDEEDDSAMEASFGQLEKEEKISSKIGLMEDLEDMKREEMEKKRKMQRLKKSKR